MSASAYDTLLANPSVTGGELIVVMYAVSGSSLFDLVTALVALIDRKTVVYTVRGAYGSIGLIVVNGGLGNLNALGISTVAGVSFLTYSGAGGVDNQIPFSKLVSLGLILLKLAVYLVNTVAISAGIFGVSAALAGRRVEDSCIGGVVLAVFIKRAVGAGVTVSSVKGIVIYTVVIYGSDGLILGSAASSTGVGHGSLVDTGGVLGYRSRIIDVVDHRNGGTTLGFFTAYGTNGITGVSFLGAGRVLRENYLGRGVGAFSAATITVAGLLGFAALIVFFL